MAFKNAVKILFNVFGLLWVILIFVLICTIIVLSLGLVAVLPIISQIRSLNIGDGVVGFFRLIMQGQASDGIVGIVELMQKLFDLFKSPSEFLLPYLFFILIIGVLARFIFALYEIPIAEVIDGYMSSNTSYKFSGKFISGLFKSLKYSLAKMLFTLPYDFLMSGLIYLMIYFLGKSWPYNLFLPFIITLVFIVCAASKESLLVFWVAEIISVDRKIYKSLKSSYKLFTPTNFKRVISTMLFSWTLIFVINFFFGLFTFGAGLIFTVPLSMLFLSLLRMTLYYSAQKKRYYIGENAIYTPGTI